MKPRNITLFIIITLAALAAVCYFFPRKGIKIGSTEIQLPSLHKFLQQHDTIADNTDSVLSEPAEEFPEIESVSVTDTTLLTDTIADIINDTLAEFVTDTVTLIPADTIETMADMTAVPKVQSGLRINKSARDTGKGSDDVLESDTVPDNVIDAISDSAAIHLPYTFLARFYKALEGADTAEVRVVHYGDSQIEGDRMTMKLRHGLQQIFGGGGVGIVPLHQTIGMRTLTQTLRINGIKQTAQQGPKRFLAFGPKSRRRDNKIYGPMAQVAVMDNRLCAGSESVSVDFALNHSCNRFTRIRIFGETDSVVNLPDSAYSYTLAFKRKGDIYGLSLETATGVMVDNIPMRGCAGTIFTGIDRKMLTHYYKATNTRLIIMQYGGNVMPYTYDRTGIDKYAEKIRRQIRYIKSCAPWADILFIGPSDMHTTRNGVRVSYLLLPVMDTALRQMAAEEKTAYWSLFEAMGGSGGMTQWIKQGLAGNDGIHFTRQGADRAGELLTEWILEGQQEYAEKKMQVQESKHDTVAAQGSEQE